MFAIHFNKILITVVLDREGVKGSVLFNWSEILYDPRADDMDLIVGTMHTHYLIRQVREMWNADWRRWDFSIWMSLIRSLPHACRS